jgi:nucleoside-diphosphate-sugar epimerase
MRQTTRAGDKTRDEWEDAMRVVILGGGGFLGRDLAHLLAETGEIRGSAVTHLHLADIVDPAPIEAPFPVSVATVDVAERAQVDAALKDADVIFHLAAVVSGQAEAEFETGMRANLTGTWNVLEAARALGTNPVVVYASSCAVYGGEIPDPIEDWFQLNPQTSYGMQKAVGELMLNDYSRKGYLDGRGLRLPTVTVRPGKPNKAASSFFSSIFREPLQGQEAICPVAPEAGCWIASPNRTVANILHAANVPAEEFGQNRCLAIPGMATTVGEMIAAMRRVAGDAPCDLIRWEHDAGIAKIVAGWPVNINPQKALRLDFHQDTAFDDNIRFFLERLQA